ncbi:hypothetical protein Emin_0194 [Elusimicrobium minutum Pei191]|uniref:Uncharacterized protein n=1 Tax=Elusimicrobium minutum (strain Pei191) TaxID=445932 RepID=B2KBS1_ELUMP|nr:hypothetical protein [Elusimicrobium minutum]ACC97758.1 hypothetical protein Emin_0194 [Elusimicrobium minutum Pei191]
MNEDTRKPLNSLFIILIKTVILVTIVMCTFFIVYPNACQNYWSDNRTEDPSILDINKPLKPVNSDTKAMEDAMPSDDNFADSPAQTAPAKGDKNYIKVHEPEPQAEPGSDQEELIKKQQAEQDAFDYEVVKRYVAIEKEYLANHPNDKNASIVITAQVMQEAQITQEDWNEIILKGTDKGWFNELRKQK